MIDEFSPHKVPAQIQSSLCRLNIARLMLTKHMDVFKAVQVLLVALLAVVQ